MALTAAVAVAARGRVRDQVLFRLSGGLALALLVATFLLVRTLWRLVRQAIGGAFGLR